MPGNFGHIVSLVYRSFSGEITAEEQQQLDQWLNASSARQSWYNELLEGGLANAMQTRTPEQRRQLSEAMHARIRQATGISTLLTVEDASTHVETFNATPTIPPVHRIHFLRTAWFKYAAAILLILGISTYLWNTQEKPTETVQHTQPVPLKNDVPAPVETKAILTLADGKRIEIDNAAAGSLARQGNTTIQKTGNGVIAYNGDAQPKTAVVAFNTLTVPRGSRIAQLTLADGTQVWLNTESSITYPVAFTATTRTVQITGEAYFEVSKDARHPFIVRTRTDTISVLGTRFNVNAYPDEAGVTTTLLEGKVKVGTSLLRPGEAHVQGKVSKANVARAMAWKNGEFQFDQADLQQVMRQLARWYDIEVEYRGSVRPRKFGGAIKRNLSLGDLLEGLKSTGLTFTIEGKKLIVQ